MSTAEFAVGLTLLLAVLAELRLAVADVKQRVVRLEDLQINPAKRRQEA